MRKLLLLVAGLPGVGKSTLSKELSRRTGARVVDMDDFKKITVDSALVTKEIDPPELRWLYYQKALAYVLGLFDGGVTTVIMDEIFHLHSLRTQVEALCVEQGVQVLWIEVRCSYATVEKRLQSMSRNGHILSTEEALKMYLLFSKVFEDFSTRDANHVVVRNDSDDNTSMRVEDVLLKVAR